MSTNIPEAVTLYRKAAEQGYADAQRQLGDMYEHGQGVRRDPAEAGKWYCKAAERGHAGAQINLGVLYSYGEGVPKDLVHPYAWSMLAAAQGEQVAEHNMELYRSEMTVQQVAKAEKLSRELTDSQDGTGETPWQQYNDAGVAAYQRGDYAEAVNQMKRALKEAKNFGEENPRFAISLDNLALFYQAQGRYAEAERLYTRALHISENALGPDHPQVATILDYLAGLYRAQGREQKAERLLRQYEQ